MCGIVGYIGKDKGQEVIIEGLSKLEYRGYDSAGIAYLDNDSINEVKTQGKVNNLVEKLITTPTSLSIGHTRWATHGEPTSTNAHPHQVGDVTIVHNGIIENYQELRTLLETKGYEFKSQTDTEVACAYIDYLYQSNNHDIIEALTKANKDFLGNYAIGVIFNQDYDHLYAIRRNAPLIIGIGDNENFIASDIIAIIKYTNKYTLLNNNYVAKISTDNITIYDENKNEVSYEEHISDKENEVLDKNGFDHYMLKEISEQGSVLAKTISSYYQDDKINLPLDFLSYDEIIIVGCGSAMYVSDIAQAMIQKELGKKVRVECASEFRYKNPIINSNDLVVVVSQSGETADTLAALELANQKGVDTLAIVNVEGSSIDRVSKYSIITKAGSEIAVASTKAFISQLAVFCLIYADMAIKLNIKTNDEIKSMLNSITNLDGQINNIINDTKLEEVASSIKNERDLFFLGRGIDQKICNEGSLKLKEITYIHSECFAAGELKHGSIALIDKDTKVIGLATQKDLYEKTISNLEEVIARGAKVTLFADNSFNINEDMFSHVIRIDDTNLFVSTILAIVNFQVLSYKVANQLGREIDQPKNLAKSVTVE